MYASTSCEFLKCALIYGTAPWYRPVVIGAHVAFLVSCGVTVLYPTVWTALGMTAMAGVYFSLLINFPYAVIPYYKVYSWYP